MGRLRSKELISRGRPSLMSIIVDGPVQTLMNRLLLKSGWKLSLRIRNRIIVAKRHLPSHSKPSGSSIKFRKLPKSLPGRLSRLVGEILLESFSPMFLVLQFLHILVLLFYYVESLVDCLVVFKQF